LIAEVLFKERERIDFVELRFRTPAGLAGYYVYIQVFH